jgi:hypothetical protein
MFKQNQNCLNNEEQKNKPKPTESNPPKHTNKHRKPDSTNNLNQKHLENKNVYPNNHVEPQIPAVPIGGIGRVHNATTVLKIASTFSMHNREKSLQVLYIGGSRKKFAANFVALVSSLF